MRMTFDQYIANPLGKDNAVLSAPVRETIRSDYIRRFNTVLLRENNRINYSLMKDSKNNIYYILLRIPSEIVTKFYYDVVIEFSADENVAEGGRDLSKYYIRFFSNDPMFVFTFAHTFIKNDLFVNDLSSKMSKSAISDAPVEKNPYELNGYVKSVYFAYLYMKQSGLFNIINFQSAPEYKKENLVSMVEDADVKIEKRNSEGKKEKKKEKEYKNRNIGLKSNNTATIGTVKTTSHIGNVKTAKSTQKSINKIRAIKRSM